MYRRENKLTESDELQSNRCTYCKDNHITNAKYIDVVWRDTTNHGYWPKPFQCPGINKDRIKGIVIGQDPTIGSKRAIEYVLEANFEDSTLGSFLRDVFSLFPHVKFDELYFTNLVKCRFKEKPGIDNKNISKFLNDLALNCYIKFLREEMKLFRSSQYIFTLGRDTFAILADLLKVPHKPLTQFKEFYGTALKISESPFGRVCYLVPLPHQPTYDRANKYLIYAHDEVARRLANLTLPVCTAEGEVDGDHRGDQGISRQEG